MEYWSYVAAGFAVGSLVSYFVAIQFFRKSDSRIKLEQLKSKHSELQSEYSEYRQSVEEHFVETAALLDDVNESQRQLYKKMATGVARLCAPENGELPEALTQRMRALTGQDREDSPDESKGQ